MTAPKPPTPLEDCACISEVLRHPTREVRPSDAAMSRLCAFLSSPVAQALSDPAMRAALEVFASAFPGMLSLFEDRSEAASITFASLVENTLKTAFTEYHRALKAKETK